MGWKHGLSFMVAMGLMVLMGIPGLILSGTTSGYRKIRIWINRFDQFVIFFIEEYKQRMLLAIMVIVFGFIGFMLGTSLLG